jgi:hypothetical protein
MQQPPGWFGVLLAAEIGDPALDALDCGEKSAIALGLSLKADLILIDDLKGAAVALNAWLIWRMRLTGLNARAQNEVSSTRRTRPSKRPQTLSGNGCPERASFAQESAASLLKSHFLSAVLDGHRRSVFLLAGHPTGSGPARNPQPTDATTERRGTVTHRQSRSRTTHSTGPEAHATFSANRTP